MQETTQSSIAFRLIFASIDRTDDLVQYTADIYNEARFVILNASDWIDHFATFIPTFLRRPLARTTSFLGRSLFAVTDRICRSAWRIYTAAQTTPGPGPYPAPGRGRTGRKPPSQANRTCNNFPQPLLSANMPFQRREACPHCVTGCRRNPAPDSRPARHQ